LTYKFCITKLVILIIHKEFLFLALLYFIYIKSMCNFQRTNSLHFSVKTHFERPSLSKLNRTNT